MSQMIDIRKVCVGPRYLTARVRVAEGAPLTTDQDLIGTTLVYNLMPEICDHVCLGDAGSTFKDAMPSTEIAHLLEHVTVELIARTGLAGSVSCGQTTHAHDCDERTFDIRLDCPDDVLVVAALSSAVWILQWAYTGGGEPEPGVDAIVQNCVSGIQPGYVILMHDGGGNRDQDLEALPKIIDQLHEQGYEFVTISELMASDDSIPDEACSGDATMPTDAVWPTEVGEG